MSGQLLRYSAFYAAIAAVAFRIGWWAARYVSDRMDKFDPRNQKGKHGW